MKFPQLNSRSLMLYDRPGKGVAARTINAAVNKASRVAIAAIGRTYSKDKAAKEIARAFEKHVRPAARGFAPSHGALDTEPRAAMYGRLVSKVADRYGLDDWGQDDLSYATY